jgi:putative sterol carrier protein
VTLEKIIDGLKDRIGDDCGLGAVIKFDFGAEGSVILDATQIPNTVALDGADPDCTMVISIDDFIAMADGSLDGVSAFMSGRLKVEGNMGIAMKLGAILT